ncbi:MAG: transcriptional repressor [Pelagibacteraceae bacterium TMED65]|nr:transcriptional repressor [Rickettsiales bacterium]OUU52013.1 MAG: transcriptional repressor [Pelagibacteraceae bacterium TMED65]|tara:strand:+ start:1278 stop:1706 length:429 start_codon:yes stop_codon:yes gene_type:complete
MKDSLLEKCNKLGLKMTEQRKVIVKVLSESTDHPDVESVYSRASKVDKRIGIATVYRTIKLFEDNNLLEKHEFKGYSSRYETVRENHHHLIDVRSGNVKEFRNTLVDAMQKQVAKEMGFKLIDYRLELYAVPIESKRSKKQS